MEQSYWKICLRFSRYLRPYTWLLLAAVATVVVISLLEVWVPWFSKYVVDEAIPRKDLGLVIKAIAGISLASLAIAGLSYLRTYLMSVVSQSVVYDLRKQVYSHLQRMDMAFFDRQRTGDLMSRIIEDVNALQRLLTYSAMELVTDFVTFAAVLIVVFWYDWRLATFMFLAFPGMAATVRVLGQKLRRAYRQVQRELGAMSSHLQETISNIRGVKATGSEEWELERFSTFNQKVKRTNVVAAALWSLFFSVISVLNQLGFAVVLGYGAYRVIRGDLTVGVLVAFLGYLQLMRKPIQRIGRLVNALQQAVASAERLFELLDQEPGVTDLPGAIDLPQVEGEIRFENVSFAYRPGEPVIAGFSETIEPGTMLAVVGPSGAGKTTLASLVYRLYDPDEGAIYIDGIDIRRVKLASLRAQIGVVTQDIMLLAGSIRDNIAYGCPDATQEEVEAAARAANAHDFICELPQGYDTQVGERGVQLSGGQRQRIAIARAILKNPRILILDEATSQLDNESEYQIKLALEKVLAGRTSLVIAHRLSTIQRADRIIVLDRGRVVEKGTHQELLAKGGEYAKLYTREWQTRDTAPRTGVSTEKYVSASLGVEDFEAELA
ncbi:MAG: ABC transporter ATP-binding protein [Firmicutes bacterium]|nr:ABC transporter ATP-binding protein [Bacillota bacterium]